MFGRDPDYVVSPGTYDQKHIARIGQLHDCIAYGPGILDLAHQPDEYVGIDDMVDSAKVMALDLDAPAAPARPARDAARHRAGKLRSRSHYASRLIYSMLDTRSVHVTVKSGSRP